MEKREFLLFALLFKMYDCWFDTKKNGRKEKARKEQKVRTTWPEQILP